MICQVSTTKNNLRGVRRSGKIKSFVLIRENEEEEFELTDGLIEELYNNDIGEINEVCPLIEEIRYFNQDKHYIKEGDYISNDWDEIIQPWLFLDPYMLDVTSINTPHQDIKNMKYPHTPKGWQWAKKSPKWHNKRFSNPNYVKWRMQVIIRDKHKCQKCGASNSNHCHHILNYKNNPNLRFDVDNGILFCKKCHNDFHTKYGLFNNTKSQLDEFLGGL